MLLMIRTSVRTCAKALRPHLGRSLGSTASHGGTDAHASQPNLALSATAAVLGVATGGMLVSRASTKKEAMPIPSPTIEKPSNNTAAEEDTLEVDASPGPQNDFGAAPLAPDDPYATLPEEDEETHCSLCRTFRQGPCRRYWRRTEACWKEKDSETCMPYSQPFFHCTQYYQNLYHLIILSNYQDDYAKLEEFALRKDAWDDASLDLQKWREFRDDLGPSFSQTLEASSSSYKLWQRVRPETDPILIPCDVRVPRVFPNGATLVQAFCADQDGHVLGVKEMRSKDTATTNSGSTETADAPVTEQKKEESTTTVAEDDDDDENATEVEFLCTLLPGATESVVLSAVYWKKDDDDDSEPFVVRKVFSLSDSTV